MAATVTARVYTGAAAGTESAAVTGIDLISADNATNSPANRAANKVVPGSYSYEKWIRLRLDTASSGVVTNLAVTRSGDLPAGVTIRFGVTDTPATPVATASTVAISEMADGRYYIFDTNSYSDAGDHSRYLVIQEHAAASAVTASIEQQDILFDYQES